MLVNICCCSVAKLCLTLVTPWTVAHQAPLSLGFPRGEYWSGLPFPSPGDLCSLGIELTSLALADGFLTEPPGKPKSLLLTTERSPMPQLSQKENKRLYKNQPLHKGKQHLAIFMKQF